MRKRDQDLDGPDARPSDGSASGHDAPAERESEIGRRLRAPTDASNDAPADAPDAGASPASPLTTPDKPESAADQRKREYVEARSKLAAPQGPETEMGRTLREHKLAQLTEAYWRAGRSGGDASWKPGDDVPGVHYDAPMKPANPGSSGGPPVPLSDPVQGPVAPTSAYQSSDPGVPLSAAKQGAGAPSPRPPVPPNDPPRPPVPPNDPGIPLSDPKTASGYALEPESDPGAMDPGVPLSNPRRKKGYGVEPDAPMATPATAAGIAKYDLDAKVDAAFQKLNDYADQFPAKIKQIGGTFDDLEGAVKRYENALADTSGSKAQQDFRKKEAGAGLQTALTKADDAPGQTTSTGEMIAQSFANVLPGVLQGALGGVAYKIFGPIGGLIAYELAGKAIQHVDQSGPEGKGGVNQLVNSALTKLGGALGFGDQGAAGSRQQAAGSDLRNLISTASGTGTPAPAAATEAAGPAASTVAGTASSAAPAAVGTATEVAGAAATGTEAAGATAAVGVEAGEAAAGLSALAAGTVATGGVLLVAAAAAAVVVGAFTLVTGAAAATAAVIWGMRDPVQAFTAAVGPFVNQVGKWNPGAVDRMNLAFDNLSASAGRALEPIIVGATQLADQFNVLWTGLAGPMRGLISEVIEPIKSGAMELATGFVGLVADGIPVARQMFQELAPLAPMARLLMQGFFDLAGWSIKTGGAIFSGVMEFVTPLVQGAQPLVGIFREGARTAGVLWDTFAPLARTFSGIDSAGSMLKWGFAIVVNELKEFAATVSATAAFLQRLAKGPEKKEGGFFSALLGGADPLNITGRIGAAVSGGSFVDDRAAARARMDAGSTPAPSAAPAQAGPMTVAAQPARQLSSIDQVGMEARTSAFSQGSNDPAQQTADNTQQTAQNTANLLDVIRTLFPGLMPQLNPGLVNT